MGGPDASGVAPQVAQERWQRERLLEALEGYRQGLSDAPYITKWSGVGVPARSREAAGDEGEGASMTFVASTEDVDRHGDVIAVGGWRLEAYRKNPVFLWAHDYARPAIGRATETWTTSSAGASSARASGTAGAALMVRVEFAPTEFAQEVAALYRGGYQRGVSVGFKPLRYEERRHQKTGEFLGIRFTEQELLEVSAAPVPANQNALRKALESGLGGAGAPRLKGYFDSVQRGSWPSSLPIPFEDTDGTLAEVSARLAAVEGSLGQLLEAAGLSGQGDPDLLLEAGAGMELGEILKILRTAVPCPR